jgi:tetratricopeptide (TPR) repeat protein
MDLLDFEGEPMYFDQPLGAEVEGLIAEAAELYGRAEAEHKLLRAYFLAPEQLGVLVALYRYFYYRHRYADALTVADRAIALAASQLQLSGDWRQWSPPALAEAAERSMSLTRFLLLALKGAGYLLMRLEQAPAALERFEKLTEIDSSDRLGITELLAMARARVTEDRCRRSGGKVRYLGR